MDIAVQAFQQLADVTNAADNRKTTTLGEKKDFGKVLEDIRSLTKKSSDAKSEGNNADALLMELLNLLNINISWQDLREILEQQAESSLTMADDILNSINTSVDELTKCWQTLIQEFSTTGEVKEDTLVKFQLAMKKVLSDDVQLDVDFVKDTISELLASRLKAKPSNFDEFHLSNLNLNNSALETLDLENEDDVKVENLDARQLKQEATIKDKTGRSKRITFEGGSGIYREFLGQDQHKAHADILPNSILTENVQKASGASKDEIITHIINSPGAPDIFDQLIDNIKLFYKGDLQEVKVRLKPDYLGEVLIKVISDKGELKAELFVSNSQVRSLLRAYAVEFQNQIRDQGYNFSEINVYRMSEGYEMGAFDHQSSGNNYQGRRFKGNSYRNLVENDQTKATETYNLWGYTSNINYMA